MSGVLVDTSVWVGYLRGGSPELSTGMDRLLAAEAVITCGPVAAELRIGDRSPVGELSAIMSDLAWSDLGRAEWRRVGEVGAQLRQAGESVRLTDISIAVAAASAGAPLWSLDQDFARIADVMPELRLYDDRSVR